MKYGRNFILEAKKWLLDMIAPEYCIGCSSRDTILCDQCARSIRRAEREMHRDIFACFDYRDPRIKNLIWKLKYYRKHSIARRLGELLYEHYMEDIADIHTWSGSEPILVIPVPISRERKKKRGYNQAEQIARSFCAQSETNTLTLETTTVMKKKSTAPQARIANRSKRLANIRGAFTVTQKEKVRGKTIIVIDDVTTTGGTLLEIMKILKEAGAKRVVGFAIAH